MSDWDSMDSGSGMTDGSDVDSDVESMAGESDDGMEDDDDFDDDFPVLTESGNIADDDCLSPLETKKRELLLELYMRQVRSHDSRYRCGTTRDDGGLYCHISVPVDFMDEEKAAACGINLDLNLVISFIFNHPPNFMCSEPNSRKGTLIIRQVAKEVDLDGADAESDFVSHGLWWTLEQRVGHFVAEQWDKLEMVANMTKEGLGESLISDNIDSLLDMMGNPEPTLEERQVVTLALKKSKKDQFRALNCLNEPKMRAELEKAAKNELAGIDAMTRPSNVLLTCIDYMLDKLETISDHCLICDAKQKLRLFKPTICESDLCGFSFIEYGLGVNIVSEIMYHSEIVDLLVSMTYAAGSQNKPAHFTPFPSSLSSSDQTVSTPHDVVKILNLLPPMKDLQVLPPNR